MDVDNQQLMDVDDEIWDNYPEIDDEMMESVQATEFR